MQGYYSIGGQGWYLAKALQTLANEITIKYPTAYCEGTIGDADHKTQGTDSDHNDWVLDPSGVGVVRAIDIGGPAAVQTAIFNHLINLYRAHDPRLYLFGYIHKDGIINDWSAAGALHSDPGDNGHVHISLTQTNGYNSVAGHSGYVAAINSTAPWGFLPAPPAQDWTDTVTPAQMDQVLTTVIRREMPKLIHFDNVRQSQAMLAGHGNAAYSEADVTAMYDDANATPRGLLKRLAAAIKAP